MTQTEQRQLDELIAIAEEADSPMRDSDKEFAVSLDDRRERRLTDKQADWFDNLVRRHLRGER